MSQDIIQQFLDEDVLVFLVGGAIAITAIVMGIIGSTIKAASRERTRREIAAYIAEGSMTPEQGERLMKAKPDNECG